MIVHGSTLSPFVRKVLAFAAEKGIAIEQRQVGIGPKTPEFLAMSPFGKIPAFEDGDYKLADSTAIVCYLDAVQPEPALIPADPRERGRVMWWDEFADTILVAKLGPVFFARVVSPLIGQEADLDAAMETERRELPPLADYLEAQLTGEFLVGGRVTLADIAVASPFVNFAHAGMTVDAARYPKLTAYIAAMHARPSFAPWIDADRQFLARVTQ